MTERLIATAQERVEVLAIAAEARALATSLGLGSREVGELALVVAELGMNALRHGGGGGLVAVAVSERDWTVEVRDAGPGLSAAVLSDAGHSDHLGADGVRPPGDGRHSLGSGLAAVRRLSTRLELSNPTEGGARVLAHRELSKSLPPHRGTSP